MFNFPVLFLLAALMTGWVGFGVLAGDAARAAKFFCVVFFLLFAITMVRGLAAG